MNIINDEATKEDIDELIHMRIAYMMDDFGSITDEERKGICTKLMNNLVEYGRKIGLGRIDLSATDEGYPIYAKVGFKDKEHRYRDMRYKF